jgi:hypothetical protein
LSVIPLVTTVLRRGLARALLPPDTYDRHRFVALLIGDAERILDVGGTQGILASFLPGRAVTTVNLEPPADVLVSGVELPFDSASFDAVASIDVLEHLPAPERRAHVRELRRVSRATIVVCCPLGTPGHRAAEADLARWYREQTGRPQRFLEEHHAHGLPSREELEVLGTELGASELLFHGDYRTTGRLFRLATLARSRPWLAVKLIWSYRRAGRAEPLAREPSEYTNRVFLVAPPRPDASTGR